MPSGPEARQVPVQEAEGGTDRDGPAEAPLRELRPPEEGVSETQGGMPLLEMRGMGVDHRVMEPDERAAMLAAILKLLGIEHRIAVVGKPERKGPKDWSPRGSPMVPLGVVVQVRGDGGWVQAGRIPGA